MSSSFNRLGLYTPDRTMLYGIAYAITISLIVIAYMAATPFFQSLHDPNILANVLDQVRANNGPVAARIIKDIVPVANLFDYICFAIIVFLGALTLILGGSKGITASVGMIASLIVLTLFQEPLIRYLALGAILFAIGMYGMVVSRNAVRVLMSIELMLNAVNINLVAFARYVDPTEIKGQAFAIFILTVAAAEAAVGLAIVLNVYRNNATVDMERFSLLKW